MFQTVSQSLASLRANLQRVPAPGGLIWASAPAPQGAALALVDLKLGEHTIYWSAGASTELNDDDPEPGRTLVGLGAARVLQITGGHRMSSAQLAIDRLFQELEVSGPVPEALRVFGGAAFSPGRDGSGCWASFGDATFVLPQVLYVDEPEGAQLFLVVPSGDPAAVERALEDAAQCFERCREASIGAQEVDALTPTIEERKDSAALPEWTALVRSIQDSIQAGTVEKIVTARRVTLRLSAAPTISKVLGRLDHDAPSCARFAFRIGERTFVGATPERLIRRRGRSIGTVALAGTAENTGEDAAAQLLSSQKDRNEHKFVVRSLAETLGPLCAELHVPDAPEVRRLKAVLHLKTLITGTLSASHTALNLVGMLHPTPAVGGVPTEAAVRWIDSHETAERGWYAAPFGWTNAGGDGEFVVALRSALINGDRVHLFAGAGIIQGSSPEAEYQETELKLRGMQRALGLPG